MSAIQKVSTVHKPEVMTQDAVLASMQPEVQVLAKEGWKKIKQVGTMDIIMLYDLGELVLALTDNQALDDSARSVAVSQLANYWSMGPQKYTPAMLYNLRTVPDTFKREFFIEQIEKPMKNGEMLNWSHFIELQKLEEEDDILNMLKQIRHNCLSSRDVKMQIESEGSAKVKRFGGRKPKMPNSPIAALRKVKATLLKSDNYLEAISAPLTTQFMDLPADQMDEKLESNVTEVLDQIHHIMGNLKTVEKHLDTLKARMAKSHTVKAAKVKVGEPKVIETTATETVTNKRGRPRKVAR